MTIVDGLLCQIDDTDVLDGVLVVPEGVEILGNIPSNNAYLVKKLILPKSLVKIDNMACIFMKNLEEVVFGGNEQEIGRLAFSNTSLQTVNIPDTVVSIGEKAFSFCSELTKVHLPKKLSSISGAMFRNCENLSEIVFPEEEFFVEEGFTTCKITKLNIPSSCKYIRDKNIAKHVTELEMDIKTLVLREAFNFVAIKKITIHTEHGTYNFNSEAGIMILETNGGMLMFDSENETYYLVDDSQFISIPENVYNKYDDLVNVYITSVGLAKVIGYAQQNGVKDSAFRNFNKAHFNRLCSMYGDDGIRKYFETIKIYNKCKKMLQVEVERYESDVFTLLYSLGLFEDDEQIRNRAIGTCAELKFYNLGAIAVLDIFHEIPTKPFNPGFARFFRENYRELKTNTAASIFAYAYENFNEISQFYKNKSGKLKVLTFDAVQEFYALENISRVGGDAEFLKVVGKYYINDEYNLERLYEIHQEAIQNQKLIDQGSFPDYFGDLPDSAGGKFKFEFLRKDANEFVILGNICDCCGRVGGVGESILIDTCNDYFRTFLVVRNDEDKIIGKCSLTYQKNENALVFNNIELNNYFMLYDMTTKDKRDILNCLVRASEAFRERIREFTDAPFAAVIGNSLTNDLNDLIEDKLDSVCDRLPIQQYSAYYADSSEYQFFITRDDDYEDMMYEAVKREYMREYSSDYEYHDEYEDENEDEYDDDLPSSNIDNDSQRSLFDDDCSNSDDEE